MISLLNLKCCFQVVLFAFFVLRTHKLVESLPTTVGLYEISEKSNLIYPRIFGGGFDDTGEYPYTVAIYNASNFVCGGTLLSSRLHVLTAASCLRGINYLDLTVRMGSNSLLSTDPGAVIMNVNGYAYNTNFDPNTYENNIGIIFMQTQAPSRISTVTLEPKSSLDQSYVNQQAVVVGYGRTGQVLNPGNPFGSRSLILKKANVTVMDNTDCGIRYHSDLPRSVLLYTKPNKFLCTLSYANADACDADTGGPLVINNVQVGVISKQITCGDPRYPAVYTRVGSYIDWITYYMDFS